MRNRFIVFRDFRYPLAQTAMVEELKGLRNVSDEEVGESLEPFSHLLTWERTFHPTPKPSGGSGEAPRQGGNDPPKKTQKTPKLSRAGRSLLHEAGVHLSRTVTEHRDAVGERSGSQAKKVLNNLINHDFIRVYTIQVGRARVKAVEVTKDGYEALGMEMPEATIKGSFSHRFLIRRYVVPFYQDRGWEVSVEYKGADVVARRPDTGECVVVEVEMRDSSHVVANVLRDLAEMTPDQILIAVESKRVKTHVRARLDGEEKLAGNRDKVSVELFSYFRK